MFTGIIKATSKVLGQKRDGENLVLTFELPKGWEDIELGESIATDGVCLTVAALRDAEYDCVLMPETLAKSSFGAHVPEQVNLERSLSVEDRFSGHFVQGHVDGMGKVVKVDQADGYRVDISFDSANKALVLYKGSVTVNGIALTITKVNDSVFSVALIPHTLEHTTLSDMKAGDTVNLEFDTIGKYVANILAQREN